MQEAPVQELVVSTAFNLSEQASPAHIYVCIQKPDLGICSEFCLNNCLKSEVRKQDLPRTPESDDLFSSSSTTPLDSMYDVDVFLWFN